MPRSNDETNQDYDILSTIAENDKTKVYLASSSMSDDPIIVKVLKNGDAQITQKIASLESPFLPKILHVDRDTIFEEYIAGDTLDKYIIDHSSSEDDIVALLLQICSGLRTLHTQTPPIIHRDLKPSNILVTEKDGEPLVKIIDFDASREYDPEKSHDTRALGTDTYAPPEQFGYSQTDVRSDIYSLGCVIDEITKDMEIDQGLRAIIAKATMFNPDQRYQSIDEVTRALLTYKRRKLSMIPVIAMLVSVAVLALGTILIFNLNKENDALSSSLKDLADRGLNNAASAQAVSPVTPQAVSPEAVQPESTDKQAPPSLTMDSYDEKTGKSVKWVFYFWADKPELSQLALKTMGAKGNAHDIRIGTESDPAGKAIDPTYWSQDSDGFIHIDSEYLKTLEINTNYTVTVDWPNLRLIFDLMCIDDLSMAKNDRPVLNPGYSEFIRKDPSDIIFHTANTFGRKFGSMKNDDTGKKLSKKDYTYDEESGTITISQNYLKHYHDGDYINLSCMFGDAETGVTICVRDVPYIMPELKQSTFAMHESDSDDIDVEINFNSAKGKLEGVFVSDKNEPDSTPVTLSDSDYEVRSDGICLKGSYLKKLKTGEYKVAFEFGDVAKSITLTVV